jgi:sugar/nucleoside kinase (ribokinase family)
VFLTFCLLPLVGAGDSFIGALGYFIAEEYSLPEAMKRACQIASVSVQAEGTQTSYPQRKDLDPALFVKSD